MLPSFSCARCARVFPGLISLQRFSSVGPYPYKTEIDVYDILIKEKELKINFEKKTFKNLKHICYYLEISLTLR